jgi:hypothetical protein
MRGPCECQDVFPVIFKTVILEDGWEVTPVAVYLISLLGDGRRLGGAATAS